MRKRSKLFHIAPGAILLLLLSLGTILLWAHGEHAKHHHNLRGVISKVEPEKNQFEIKTDAGRVVLCLIDDKSNLRRGSEKITLKQVRVGDRARCHCAALKGGRHYSKSLLVEKKNK